MPFFNGRCLFWNDDSDSIRLLPHLLTIKGALIKRDFTLAFEGKARYWPRENLTRFLTKCGPWFSKLDITTIDFDTAGNIKYQPLPAYWIEQIRKSSLIPSIST